MTVLPTATDLRACEASGPAGWVCEVDQPHLAVDETVILLHPPLPLVGVSIGMERGCQQNDSLVRG